VASLDQRHLVTIGAEGFRAGYPAVASMAGPAGGGFADLCAVPAITLCSAHLFPKYLADPGSPTGLTGLMQGWRSDADRLGKPILVEELGYSLADGGDAGTRAAFFAGAASAVRSNDLDGALLWNLGRTADRSFTLAWNDAASTAVLNRWPEVIARH
jgi:endo-1,4-beta-mannosidase